MKAILFIILTIVRFCSFGQVTEQDTVFILIEKEDSLIERNIVDSSSTSFYAAYYLYDKTLVEETKSALEKGIIVQGACDYYYFDTYDTGSIIDERYLENRIVYTRKDLVTKGVHTMNFYSVEEDPKGLRIRKLFFSACE